MLEALQIFAGLTFLIYGGDVLVDGSVALAKRMNISKAVIGLTIVAFGTSAPEFVVNITSVLKEKNDIAIGNIIGSNISNTFLILGISTFFAKIALDDKQIRNDTLFLSLITFLFIGISYYQGFVGLYDGILYLALLILYSIKKYRWVRQNKIAILANIEDADENYEDTLEHELAGVKALFMVIIGITMLIIGGDFTVLGAIGIANMIGVSEAVISVTIIAIGSSAPELSACISACKKGHSEIAISNVVGSNIFNIILGLGAIAIFRDIEISDKFLKFDLIYLAMAMTTLLIACLLPKKIGRVLATIFVLLYTVFIILQYTNI